MAVRKILLLGNPALYRKSAPVRREELDDLVAVVADLRDTLVAFRERRGVGRAIAAPQIGVMTRLVYHHEGGDSGVFINPELVDHSTGMIEVWDDCMSFPDLMVKVRRHRSCRIRYRDLDWERRERALEGAASELFQHEVDHLDGILAVSRAVNAQSFSLASERGGRGVA